MKWVRYHGSEGIKLGVLTQNGIVSAESVTRADLPAKAKDAVHTGDFIEWMVWGQPYDREVLARASEQPGLDPASVRLLAPIPKTPKNIFCIGRNYRSHAAEAARFLGQPESIPEHPMIFTKPYTAIIDPDSAIRFEPEVTEQLDYEGELAVIIGKAGRNIPRAEAMEYVYGYTLMNDVTARDLQHQHKQYFKGKGLDTYAPLGPAVVPRDAVGDVTALRLQTFVNGELRQNDTISSLIFSIPELIQVISLGMTLEPGDIISTGTPAGVGVGFTPPRYLRDGDVVEVEIAEIGRLKNPVQA